MKKNVLINLRVEQDLKESFQQIAENNGYTMSDVITASMKEIVRRGTIPFYLSSKLPRKNRSIISIQEIKIAVENAILKEKLNNKIKSVSIFGSYAIGTMNHNSDIDLIVEASDSFGISGLSLLNSSLEEALGKKVDITIAPATDPYFSQIINREKITIYERK